MLIKNVDNFILRGLRYLHYFLKGSLILLIFFILINSFIFTFYKVDGQSMEPTLDNQEIIPIFLLAYTFSAPKISDIIVLHYIGDNKVQFVKRIVGIPGDRVMFSGKEITLSSDQYFVEGDNRNFSTDSRIYGPILRSQIVGKVF